MIEIAKASIEDLPGIKKVDELSFVKDSYPLFVLRQYLDIVTNYFLVAKDNDEIIGYSIGTIVVETNQGWVLSLGVHPKSRGKNIGYTLTKKLVTILEDKGCSDIVLTVHPNNTSAIRIYEKIGFKEVSRSTNYYLDNEERIVMRKVNN